MKKFAIDSLALLINAALYLGPFIAAYFTYLPYEEKIIAERKRRQAIENEAYKPGITQFNNQRKYNELQWRLAKRGLLVTAIVFALAWVLTGFIQHNWHNIGRAMRR